MAPRLSRWVLLTAGAACVVATLTLTTGGTPLVFLRSAWGGEESERERVSRRIWELRMALDQVRTDLAVLDMREQLAAVATRSDADPLVLRRQRGRLVIDAPATAAMESLWRRIPARRGDVRSVIVTREPASSYGTTVAHLDSNGVCLAWSSSSRSHAELVTQVRGGAGECLFAEQFGPPGAGVRKWQAHGLRTLAWDRDPRPPFWDRYSSEVVDWVVPSWYLPGRGFDQVRFNYEWRELSRLEAACLVGRSEMCEAASGVGERGWPDDRRGLQRGFRPPTLPQNVLPRDLLRAVGPAKFGEIWTSDDPIAGSYARVTGAPMDGWIMEWARRQWGTIHRDNALSLVGWLGAFVWIGLFGLLVAQRLKQRTVT